MCAIVRWGWCSSSLHHHVFSWQWDITGRFGKSCANTACYFVNGLLWLHAYVQTDLHTLDALGAKYLSVFNCRFVIVSLILHWKRTLFCSFPADSCCVFLSDSSVFYHFDFFTLKIVTHKFMFWTILEKRLWFNIWCLIFGFLCLQCHTCFVLI